MRLMFWPFVGGFLIPFGFLGALLLWEWSCDEKWGGWASEYRACNFWTTESTLSLIRTNGSLSDGPSFLSGPRVPWVLFVR